MRVLIADDEAPARERLRQMLATYPDVEVVGEAANGAEAMNLAAALRPDLMILDIQMPAGTGLDVAACLPPPRPSIIFCTAYDQHAIEAFELNAIDYLLKPVSRARLAQAITRMPAAPAPMSVDRVMRELQSEPLSRFLVRSGSHYVVVPAAAVVYFESVDGLTRLVVDTGREYWMDLPVQQLETRVDPSRFFRISRSVLVSLDQVVEIHPLPGGSAEAVLKKGVRLEVSRRRLRDLLTALERGGLASSH